MKNVEIIREIETFEEKSNFLKKQLKSYKSVPVNEFILMEYQDKKIFLSIKNLRGNKYFYHIPHSRHLSNDWPQLAFHMKSKINAILQHMKMFEARIKPYTDEEALEFINNLNNEEN